MARPTQPRVWRLDRSKGTGRKCSLCTRQAVQEDRKLIAAGLKERADQAARLESELREARAALAKSEQHVADLQAQLSKAGCSEASKRNPLAPAAREGWISAPPLL